MEFGAPTPVPSANSVQGRNAAGQILPIGSGAERVIGGTGRRLLGEQRELVNNVSRSFGDSSFELGGNAVGNTAVRGFLDRTGFEAVSRFSSFFGETVPLFVRSFPTR